MVSDRIVPALSRSETFQAQSSVSAFVDSVYRNCLVTTIFDLAVPQYLIRSSAVEFT